MCLYWKKVYLCGCKSHLFRDRCPVCLHSSSEDKCENFVEEEEPRSSYFQCYNCIVKEDREEKEKVDAAKIEADKAAVEEQKKARAETARRDAELRAQREREDEVRRQRDIKAEAERRKREGGAWQETSGGKKGRSRKGHNANVITTTPTKPVGFPAGVGVFGPLSKDPADTTSSSATAKDASNGAATPKGKGAAIGNRMSGTGSSNSTRPSTPSKAITTLGNGNGTTSTKGKADVTNTKENAPPANGNGTTSSKEHSAPTNGNGASTKLTDVLTAKPDTASSAQLSNIDPGGRAGRWGPTNGPKKILKPEAPAWNMRKV